MLSTESSQLPVTSFHSSLTHRMSPQETYTQVHLISRSRLSRRNHLLCFPPSVPPSHPSLGIHPPLILRAVHDLELAVAEEQQQSLSWMSMGNGWHEAFSGHPSMLPLLSPLHSSAQKAVPAHCCRDFALPDKQETPAYASEALKLG